MRYHYWTVRFVPDVARGEFINIGVLIGGDEPSDWAFRHVDIFKRANTLGGDAASTQSFLTSIKQRIQDARGPADLFGERRGLTYNYVENARAHQSNAVQFGAPEIVEAPNAEAALRIIYPVMVEEPPARERRNSRERLVRELGDELDRALPSHDLLIRRSTPARADKQRGSFDFVLESDGRFQLAHAWSFLLQNPDRLATQHQAWAWFVNEFRRQGAVMVPRGGRSLEIDRETPLLIVHDRPETEVQREVLESARASWEQLEVDVFEEDVMGDAVEQIGGNLALAS